MFCSECRSPLGLLPDGKPAIKFSEDKPVSDTHDWCVGRDPLFQPHLPVATLEDCPIPLERLADTTKELGRHLTWCEPHGLYHPNGPRDIRYAIWTEHLAQSNGFSVYSGLDGQEVKTTGVFTCPLEAMATCGRFHENGKKSFVVGEVRGHIRSEHTRMYRAMLDMLWIPMWTGGRDGFVATGRVGRPGRRPL